MSVPPPPQLKVREILGGGGGEVQTLNGMAQYVKQYVTHALYILNEKVFMSLTVSG